MDDFKPIKYSINNYEKTILSKFLTLSNPKIILELGVDKGSTTKFILDFLSENKIMSSKSEARRAINNNGIKINNIVVTNEKKIFILRSHKFSL